MNNLVRKNNQENQTKRTRDMAKSPKICQKLHFLTPKTMLNMGQNYQLYTPVLIIYN